MEIVIFSPVVKIISKDRDEKRIIVDVGSEEGTEVFIANTPTVGNGWVDTPDNLKRFPSQCSLSEGNINQRNSLWYIN